MSKPILAIQSITGMLVYNTEQATTIAEIGTVINNYVNEMIARFITGDANLDSDWDQYIKELDNKGLPKLLEAVQQAYDYKYKK